MKLLDNSRISLLNAVFLFVIVIYAGKATIFTSDFGNILSLGNAVAMLLTAIVFFKNDCRLETGFWKAISVFAVYAVATTINNGQISPMWLTQWPMFLFVAYTICQIFKEHLIAAYETILLYLSVVALILWSIQLIYPSAIYALVTTFAFSSPFSESNTIANMIIYTLSTRYDTAGDFALLVRNSGFAWEPGAYASLVALAIFCNILRCGIKVRGNVSLIVLSLALLSTQSTTGIFILVLMLVGYFLINGQLKWSILALPLVLGLLALPFVYEKVMSEINDIATFNIDSLTYNDHYSITRVQSFLLYLEDFKLHPILGLGGNAGGNFIFQQGYDNISLTSGLGELLSRYGIIMSSIFLYSIFKSGKCMNEAMSTKGGYLLVIPIIGMMASYSIWIQPIYISFWLYFLFTPFLQNNN